MIPRCDKHGSSRAPGAAIGFVSSNPGSSRDGANVEAVKLGHGGVLQHALLVSGAGVSYANATCAGLHLKLF